MSLNVTNVKPAFAPDSFEYMETLVKTQSDIIRLVTVYRPPSSGKNGIATTKFFEEFHILLDSYVTLSGQLLIVGDFNIHLDNKCDKDSLKFQDLLTCFQLKQHVNEATHRKGHMLDLAITREGELELQEVNVHASIISDHSAISIKIHTTKNKVMPSITEYRNIKEIDIVSFKQDIKNSSLLKAPSEGLNNLVEQYHSTLTDILDAHAPLKKRKKTIKLRPKWYNNTILSAKKVRRRAERRWRKTKLTIHHDILKSEQQNVNKLCAKAKTDFYSGKIEETNKDQKKLFQVSNELLHRKKVSSLPSHADPSELADKLADYFSDKIEKIRDTFNPSSDSSSLLEPAPDDVPILTELLPTTEEELKKIINSSNSKTCHLDPIPTSLLKESLDVLLPTLCNIVNLSFSTNLMPSSLKSATVTPILKKSNLDKENMKNYRPVSNLSYLSKLIEKVAVNRMNNHMTEHNLHEIHQSAYRPNHSTETALLKIFNDILCAVDAKKCVMLVLLDLSAAFDTIEHRILFERMELLFGISGGALAWLQSYLSDRFQSVNINGFSSTKKSLKYGLPQGSMVGPFSFPHYESPLGRIAAKHGISIHLYADDTQLYLSFGAEDGEVSRDTLEVCLEEIRLWMSENMLKLNESKTEFIIIGSKFSLPRLPDIFTVSIGDDNIAATSAVKNIGATIDDKMSMVPQINSICKSCYLHLRHLGQIRKYLTPDATATLVHAFVTSKLDNLNSLLHGIPDYLIDKLQLIQNQAAKIILRKKKFDSVTPLLRSLHWLPVQYRLDFKILLITFKCLNGHAPEYLCKLLHSYVPSRSLRSSSKDLLKEPSYRTNSYGKRAFSVIAPRLWNSLPMEIKSSPSVASFKRSLKTHLFKQAFP